MKRSAILIILIALSHIASAQGPSFKVQSEQAQSMLRIQRETVTPSARGLMEIHEYTHPLLKKYLPDYKFYLTYIPAHIQKYRGSDGKEKESLVKASYLTGLGVVDRENRVSLFDNRRVRFLDLGQAFLGTANISRSTSSRTDDELKEIASMYLILSSLKGLNGSGLLSRSGINGRGFQLAQDIKPEDFSVDHRQTGITVTYKLDNDSETLECSLSFDLDGNVTSGKAYYSGKFKFL
jgi:hypothetical protein